MIIKMDRIKVVEICIANEWYKRGSLAEYAFMLDMCDWDIDQTEESIKGIARNIFEHSFEKVYNIEYYISDIRNIASILLNNCCHFFLS